MFLSFKATQPIYTIPRTINSSTLNYNSTFLLINSEFRTDQYLFGFEFFGVAYTFTQTNYFFNMTGVNKTICSDSFYKNYPSFNDTLLESVLNVTNCQQFNNLTNISSIYFENATIQSSVITVKVIHNIYQFTLPKAVKFLQLVTFFYCRDFLKKN